MSRQKEPELIHCHQTPSIHFPIPQLNLVGFPTLKYEYLQPEPYADSYYLYLWASKDDYLPFHAGMGTLHETTNRHKYPGGGFTLQQAYRDLCGDQFVCIILSDPTPYYYAMSLLHYTYHFYTKLGIQQSQTKEANQFALQQSSNTNALICTPEPIIPQTCHKYKVIAPLPLPSISPPESLGVRHGRQQALKEKLIKWLQNREYQLKKREAK